MFLAVLQGEMTQDEYLHYSDIELRFERLPRYVYGFIYKYKDKILIAINKSLSNIKIKTTILHELAHFELKHLDNFMLEFKIENLEDEADKYVESLLKNINNANNHKDNLLI